MEYGQGNKTYVTRMLSKVRKDLIEEVGDTISALMGGPRNRYRSTFVTMWTYRGASLQLFWIREGVGDDLSDQGYQRVP